MWGFDTTANGLPSSSHEQWALPDARRGQHWAEDA
jgi:hypothetical protein